MSTLTLSEATTGYAGLMTAADKSKLNGIEAGANKTLFDNAPTAGSTKAVTSDGIYSAIDQVAVDLSDTQADVVLKANSLRKSTDANGINLDLRNTNSSLSLVTIPFADANTDGIMSSTDYSKLAALPTNTDLQTALGAKGGALAGDITAAGYEIDLKSGNTSLSQVYIPFATAQIDGLMSSTDYSKLAGIATGATRVIVDSTFDTTSSNAISNSAVATALGDIDTILDNINGD